MVLVNKESKNESSSRIQAKAMMSVKIRNNCRLRCRQTTPKEKNRARHQEEKQLAYFNGSTFPERVNVSFSNNFGEH